jgi:hypothetical protein
VRDINVCVGTKNDWNFPITNSDYRQAARFVFDRKAAAAIFIPDAKKFLAG